MRVVKPTKLPTLHRVVEVRRRLEFHVARILAFPFGTPPAPADVSCNHLLNTSRRTVTSGTSRWRGWMAVRRVIACSRRARRSGPWTQIVSGAKTGVFGSWNSTVGGKWTVNATGDVTLSSATQVTIIASAKITQMAPEVEKITGKFGEHTSVSFQSYGSCNTFGIQKEDLADFVFSHTGVGVAAIAVKLEAVGIHDEHAGTKKEILANKLVSGAMAIFSMGLTKL